MDPILCDYCDELAAMFFPRGSASERSFACAGHEQRAKMGAGSLPGQGLVDVPIPDRNHFENLDHARMLLRWAQHHAALRR